MQHLETSAISEFDAATAPNVRIDVSDFGPIASGTVDVRPLTIFVGPSNSGKTYLAVLLYALSETFGGFSRFPGSYPLGLPSISSSGSRRDKRWTTLAETLARGSRSIRFEDIPGRIQTAAQSDLKSIVTNQDGLILELNRCFDIDQVSELVRWQDDAAGHTRISVSANDGNERLWWFDVRLGVKGKSRRKTSQSPDSTERPIHSGVLTQFRGRVENFQLSLPSAGTVHGEFLAHLVKSISASSNSEKHERISHAILDVLHYNGYGGTAYYLPAARSGIMQSHRIIASSLFMRATRAGLERIPELPTFSGMVADFMENLILNGDQDKGYSGTGSLRKRIRQLRRPALRERERDPVAALATELEQTMLNGRIQSRDESNNQYPDFVYAPSEVDLQIRMTRSSSMVSELAPIVLFLRRIVEPGDMLIIEEPEAHLHPAAQAEMALVLAKLARAGVRVLVTTHSDWLLKQVGNLIRQGELYDCPENKDERNEAATSLQPEHVGVWLFQKNDPSQGSTIKEIRYDRLEGIEPAEYADVDEQLYNRSADLQNLLDDREVGGSL